MARVYKIREICGDWALRIKKPPEKPIFLFFKSRNNAELVKKILELEDAHPNEAVPYKPTLAPPNEWVSVEERLPENNAQVLMWSAKWNIAEAGSYYNGRFWVYSEIGDAYIADDITHWMLLPAPPDRRPPEGEEDA